MPLKSSCFRLSPGLSNPSFCHDEREMMTDCKLEGVEREAKCLLLAAFYSSLSLSSLVFGPRGCVAGIVGCEDFWCFLSERVWM